MLYYYVPLTLSVTYEPFILSVIMLNVVRLSVVMSSVVAPLEARLNNGHWSNVFRIFIACSEFTQLILSDADITFKPVS